MVFVWWQLGDKKVFLKISQNSQENTCPCEIFKNTHFEENLRTDASELN